MHTLLCYLSMKSITKTVLMVYILRPSIWTNKVKNDSLTSKSAEVPSFTLSWVSMKSNISSVNCDSSTGAWRFPSAFSICSFLCCPSNFCFFSSSTTSWSGHPRLAYNQRSSVQNQGQNNLNSISGSHNPHLIKLKLMVIAIFKWCADWHNEYISTSWGCARAR